MKRGLTFIEMLITIGATALIMAGLTDTILYFYRANTSSLEQAYQIESARRGLDAMVRDMREATYADDGSYPLAVIATSSITFYVDTDHDSSVERVRYVLIGTQLKRVMTEAAGSPPTYTGTVSTSTVSDYVRNFEQGRALFRYYAGSGAEVTSFVNGIADVRSISVDLVVNVLPVRAPGDFTIRSSGNLRNLRTQ